MSQPSGARHQSYVIAFLRTPSGGRCWVNKKTKDKGGVVLTHTFMDGTYTGKLCVLPSLLHAWDEAVAKDVQAGTLPPINELRTPHVFNFFIDFDCKLRTPEAMRIVTAHDVGRVCIESVRRFLPRRRDLRAIVATTPDKPADDADPSAIKRGLHLYFPNVVVTTHEALLMREATIILLGRLTQAVDWAADFDNSVYVNSSGGLRMVGASKARQCSKCRNVAKEREECVACLRTGHEVMETQRYHVEACIGCDGVVDEELTGLLRRNAAACMRACTVRTTAQEVSPDWQCFDGCPSYAEVKQNRRAPPTAGDPKRKFPEEAKSFRKWPKATVQDPKKIECLRNIFRHRFHEVYKNVDISQVSYMAKTKTYYAQFCNEGENFCLNIMGRHKSNRVYGVVQGNKAFVRCHCQCAKLDGRIQGMFCRDFKSDHKALTSKDMRVLDVVDDEAPAKTKVGSVNADSYLDNLSQTLFEANNM